MSVCVVRSQVTRVLRSGGACAFAANIRLDSLGINLTPSVRPRSLFRL